MIKLLLFAHLQEEVGQSELMIETDKMTVEQLKTWVKNEYTVSNIESVMVAVNEQYAIDTDELKSGDVVALIPPLSGG